MIFIKHVRNSLKVETAIENVIILMRHSETRDWRVGEYPSGRGGMQFWCDGNGRGLGRREKTRIPSASKGLLKTRHLIYLSQFLSHYSVSRYVVREQKISLNVSSKLT